MSSHPLNIRGVLVAQRADGTTPPVCHLASFSLHPPATNLGTDEKMPTAATEQ